MEIRPFIADELSNSSYLVLMPEADLAIAVDPLRDIEQYLDVVEPLGLKLESALEIHVHNDFVSAARELQAQAGATIGASADADLRMPTSRCETARRSP